MKKTLLIVLIACAVSTSVFTQHYTTALGLRFGYLQGGFTVKHFINEVNSVEGILNIFDWHYTGVTGLYQFNKPLGDVEGLSWYWGFGAHIGFWDSPLWEDPQMTLGPDGIIGIEYTFAEVPLSLSLDWHPFINLVPDMRPHMNWGGLSVRYIF